MEPREFWSSSLQEYSSKGFIDERLHINLAIVERKILMDSILS